MLLKLLEAEFAKLIFQKIWTLCLWKYALCILCMRCIQNCKNAGPPPWDIYEMGSKWRGGGGCTEIGSS